MGSLGIFPVKKNQSTARLRANSAAEPAKMSSTNSGSPQIFLTTEPGATKSRSARGAQTSRITFLCIDVEVAVDLKRFNLFGEVKSLHRLGRRYRDFLAVNGYANRHREPFDHSPVAERQSLSGYLVS